LNDETILRHLCNDVDPEWQNEYRTMFHQACLIRHPNVARTLEVLEMSGSPAVVQEWLIGLPGTEWASQVTEPSVALRLIQQSAAGLAAVHEADLVHGQLQLGRLLLTAQGELKICGAGEPKWLSGSWQAHARVVAQQRSYHDDIVQLTSLVAPWCRSKSRGQPKPVLADFVKTLEEHHFTSAVDLKNHVDDTLSTLESDEDAWQRLLQFVQDRLTIPETATPQKKSA
jgi:hypothetical protein